jgi:hypothetical protein
MLAPQPVRDDAIELVGASRMMVLQRFRMTVLSVRGRWSASRKL